MTKSTMNFILGEVAFKCFKIAPLELLNTLYY